MWSFNSSDTDQIILYLLLRLLSLAASVTPGSEFNITYKPYRVSVYVGIDKPDIPW